MLASKVFWNFARPKKEGGGVEGVEGMEARLSR